MDKNNVIATGNSPNSKMVAFGDDSQFGDNLVFAFVVVKRTRILAIERGIKEIKDRFGIPRNMPLHCRTLFSGDQRRKAGIENVSREDVRDIVAQAVTLLNNYGVELRYAIASLAEQTRKFGSSITFTNAADESTFQLPISPDPKGFIGLLMNVAVLATKRRRHALPSTPALFDCQIIVSEDKTKIRFIGGARGRADKMYAGFSDINAPAGEVFQYQPTIATASTSPLLELADIAAYICAHSVGTTVDRFFLEQLNRFNHACCARA